MGHSHWHAWLTSMSWTLNLQSVDSEMVRLRYHWWPVDQRALVTQRIEWIRTWRESITTWTHFGRTWWVIRRSQTDKGCVRFWWGNNRRRWIHRIQRLDQTNLSWNWTGSWLILPESLLWSRSRGGDHRTEFQLTWQVSRISEQWCCNCVGLNLLTLRDLTCSSNPKVTTIQSCDSCYWSGGQTPCSLQVIWSWTDCVWGQPEWQII